MPSFFLFAAASENEALTRFRYIQTEAFYAEVGNEKTIGSGLAALLAL